MFAKHSKDTIFTPKYLRESLVFYSEIFNNSLAHYKVSFFTVTAFPNLVFLEILKDCSDFRVS